MAEKEQNFQEELEALKQGIREHIRDMEGMWTRLIYYKANNELDAKRIDEITERLGDTIRKLKCVLGEPF